MMFVKIYKELEEKGYFAEAFGFWCVDDDHVAGKIGDVEMEILLTVRKRELWPIDFQCHHYAEDDFFDVLEFLFQHVSKPIDGTMHSHNGCGMHWETFNKDEGKKNLRERVNKLLNLYERKYELSPTGEILIRPESGFERIFDADVPSKEVKVVDRIEAATNLFRRHGSSLEDRRRAVRDLADVLEYLRTDVQKLLTRKDEQDLFNIANNFGIRHHNDRQKTDYDSAIWLSWMFYFYLSTIHVVLRKVEHDKAARS